MKALLIIDVQNDYFPGGSFELNRAEETMKVIQGLIQQFRAVQLPIIYVQHLGSSTSTFLGEGTQGAMIHPDIQPLEKDTVVVKHHPNSFKQTNLKQVLDQKEIDELVVCGMMSHMCVDTTVRAAKDFDYKITVIENACTTRDLKWKTEIIPAETVHNSFMSALSGAFADVVSYEEFTL